MREPMTPDDLDRYLDALVTGDAGVASDPELATIARRYIALGQRPAPLGTRARILRRLTQPSGSRQNGHHDSHDPLLRQMVLPPSAPHPVPEPGPLHSRVPATDIRWHRLAWRSWPVLLLVLGVIVMAVIWQGPRFLDRERVLMAVEQTAPTPTPNLPPAAGHVVLAVDLPAGLLPVDGYGVTFDQRTLPPQQESTDVTAGPLLVRFIVAGQVRVQADTDLEVWHADGDGSWNSVPAATPLTLASGDAIALRGAATLTWMNETANPVEMLAWGMTNQGGGNSEVPPGWTLHDNTAVHLAVFEHPEQAEQLTLRRIELAPGEDVGPPPGAWLSQFVALDRNAAGDVVAPMFGKLPDGAKRNAGRQPLTIYQYTLTPLDVTAAPSS